MLWHHSCFFYFLGSSKKTLAASRKRKSGTTTTTTTTTEKKPTSRRALLEAVLVFLRRKQYVKKVYNVVRFFLFLVLEYFSFVLALAPTGDWVFWFFIFILSFTKTTCDTTTNAKTTTNMESTTTSSKTPADFLKSIRGKRVVVKLNSGVDYRGTKRFANNKDFTQRARKMRLSSSYSYIKKDRSFVRVVCACVTHACVFSCLSCMDADTTALIFFYHDRYFSVLRWIHEHCDGTHRGTRVVNGLVESLTKLLCLFAFREKCESTEIHHLSLSRSKR